MHLQCYSIRDNKVGIFQRPFFVRNVHEATRGLIEVVSDKQSTLHRFHQDYSLFLLFSVDEETGIPIPTSLGLPQFTINISELVQKESVVPLGS